MSFPRRIRTSALAVVGVVLVVTTGCGPGVGNVSGVVTYKGKPLTTGSVIFAVVGHPPVVVAIDPAGNYSARDVPAGPSVVSVTSPDPRVLASRGGGKGAGDMTPDEFKELQSKGGPDPQKLAALEAKNWVAIPEKYADLRGSGLSFEVKRGESTYEIKLD